MATSILSQPGNGQLLCALVYNALKREEEEIQRIRVGPNPPERCLLSVAFAPELAMGYLVRKQALVDRLEVECECKDRDGTWVDLCLFRGGAWAASAEIKGPWGIWRADRDPLKKDVSKVLRQCLPGSQLAEQYNVWILVQEDEMSAAAVEAFVLSTVGRIARVAQCFVSDPIPINQNDGAAAVWNNRRHSFLRVAVFRCEEESNPLTLSMDPIGDVKG